MKVVLDLDDLSFENAKNIFFLDNLRDHFPKFKVTLFGIPMKMDDHMITCLQERGYIQIAMHGWEHDTSMEAWAWRHKPDILSKLDWWRQKRDQFSCLVLGFKAPGWWITPQTVDVLNMRLHGHLDDSPKNGIVLHYDKLFKLDKNTKFLWIEEVM